MRLTLTAAVWFVLLIFGELVIRPSQTFTTLSFPPLASNYETHQHLLVNDGER